MEVLTGGIKYKATYHSVKKVPTGIYEFNTMSVYLLFYRIFSMAPARFGKLVCAGDF